VIKPPSCPVCSKPIDDPSGCKSFPFCSTRCRQVDFFRWWDGRYAVVEELAPPPIDGTGLQPGQILPGVEDPDHGELD